MLVFQGDDKSYHVELLLLCHLFTSRSFKYNYMLVWSPEKIVNTTLFFWYDNMGLYNVNSDGAGYKKWQVYDYLSLKCVSEITLFSTFFYQLTNL